MKELIGSGTKAQKCGVRKQLKRGLLRFLVSYKMPLDYSSLRCQANSSAH